MIDVVAGERDEIRFGCVCDGDGVVEHALGGGPADVNVGDLRDAKPSKDGVTHDGGTMAWRDVFGVAPEISVVGRRRRDLRLRDQRAGRRRRAEAERLRARRAPRLLTHPRHHPRRIP